MRVWDLRVSHPRQNEKHPQVNEEHQEIMEVQFPENRFAQKKCSVYHNQTKLHEQHQKKRHGYAVLCYVSSYTTVALLSLRK